MMSHFGQLTTVEQWEEAAAGSTTQPLCVFKHSPRCPISAEAIDAWNKWLNDNEPSGIRQERLSMS